MPDQTGVQQALSGFAARRAFEPEIVDECDKLDLTRDVELLISTLPVGDDTGALDRQIDSRPVDCFAGNHPRADLNFPFAEIAGDMLEQMLDRVQIHVPLHARSRLPEHLMFDGARNNKLGEA